MNSIIGAAVVNFSNLAFNCSGVSSCWIVGAGAGVAVETVAVGSALLLAVAAWELSPKVSKALTNSLGSAPVSSFKIVPFLMSTK